MASRQVQIPSGKPYCFVCNTSFQSTYNLNRHNASYRQKHAEIQARMEERQAAQMDQTSQPSNIATVNSSISPQVYRVRTVYTTAAVPSVFDQLTTVKNDTERMSSLVAKVLDEPVCRSITGAVQCLVEQQVEPERAQLIVEATFAAAKHVAGLHAAYEQLRAATKSATRDETLSQLADQFVCFLIGPSRREMALRRDTYSRVSPTPPKSMNDVSTEATIAGETLGERNDSDQAELEDIEELPTLDERLPMARELFQIEISDNENDGVVKAMTDQVMCGDRTVIQDEIGVPEQRNEATDHVPVNQVHTHVVAKHERVEVYKERGFIVKHTGAGKRPARGTEDSMVVENKKRKSPMKECGGQPSAKHAESNIDSPPETSTASHRSTRSGSAETVEQVAMVRSDRKRQAGEVFDRQNQQPQIKRVSPRRSAAQQSAWPLTDVVPPFSYVGPSESDGSLSQSQPRTGDNRRLPRDERRHLAAWESVTSHTDAQRKEDHGTRTKTEDSRKPQRSAPQSSGLRQSPRTMIRTQVGDSRRCQSRGHTRRPANWMRFGKRW